MIKKKIIIVFVFIFTISFSALTNAIDGSDLFGSGNLKQNTFIVAENMYGVIFNPTEETFIASKLGALNYCQKILSNNNAASTFFPLKIHTSYFSCVTSIESKLDNFNLSENEIFCLNYLIFEMNYLYAKNKSCLELEKKLTPIHSKIQQVIDLENKYKNQKHIINVLSDHYLQISEYENNFIKQPNILIISKNIETCKEYSFIEGSDLFSQCILKLLELGDFTFDDPKRLKSKLRYNQTIISETFNTPMQP